MNKAILGVGEGVAYLEFRIIALVLGIILLAVVPVQQSHGAEPIRKAIEPKTQAPIPKEFTEKYQFRYQKAIQSPLTAVTLVSPASATTVKSYDPDDLCAKYDFPPEFKWNRADRAEAVTGYTFYIKNITQNKTPHTQTTTKNSTRLVQIVTQKGMTLTANNEYRWRVRADRGTETGPWSAEWTIIGVPGDNPNQQQGCTTVGGAPAY
jgi:hypothetical protein